MLEECIIKSLDKNRVIRVATKISPLGFHLNRAVDRISVCMIERV